MTCSSICLRTDTSGKTSFFCLFGGLGSGKLLLMPLSIGLFVEFKLSKCLTFELFSFPSLFFLLDVTQPISKIVSFHSFICVLKRKHSIQ